MAVWCVRCNEVLPLLEIGDHFHLCPGETEEEDNSPQEQAEGD